MPDSVLQPAPVSTARRRPRSSATSSSKPLASKSLEWVAGWAWLLAMRSPEADVTRGEGACSALVAEVGASHNSLGRSGPFAEGSHMLELDHIFCMVPEGGEWASRAEKAGWLLDQGMAHSGQGTRNRRLPW